MELQFQKSTCTYLDCPVREVQNTELTQEIRLSDGMPDIGRVIASWGQVVLRGKEWMSDSVSVNGALMVWILYAPEDGTEPRTVDGWVPFQMKWNLPAGCGDGAIRAVPLLRFVDSRNTSARKLFVRAGIAVMAETFCPSKQEIFRPDELPEDVQILTKTYPMQLPKEAGEKTFYVDEEIAMPGAADAEKILSFRVDPQLQEQKVSGSKLILRGTADLHVVYRSQTGRIQGWDTAVPFAQYAELDTEYGTDAQADVRMGVTSLELDRNDQGLLRLKCGLVAQYLIEDRELVEVAEDAYSPRREVQADNLELALPAILETRNDMMDIHQNLPGQGGGVADVVFLPDYPRCSGTENGICVQMSGVFQILCYGEDEVLRSGSVRWDSKKDYPADGDVRAEVSLCPPRNASARPEGDGIGLQAKMELQLRSTTGSGIPMVSALQLGELQEPDGSRPALILRRPSGKSLWELAKASGSTVDAIRSANHLQEEPADNGMLLIPLA